jgi:endonuclease/exonuclease/phosphatase family metal-dependent hydrolase
MLCRLLQSLFLVGMPVFVQSCASVEREPSSYPKKTDSKKTDQFRILSFNLWREDTHDRLPSFAAALHAERPFTELPDVILVQESLEQLEHVDGSTAQFLGRLLGMKTNFRKRSSDNEGVAVLTRSEVREVSWKELSYEPSDPYRRLALAVSYEDPRLGRVVALTLHLASERRHAALREKQIQDLWDFIRSFKNVDTLIVGGDFNAHPKDPEMLAFAAEWKRFGSWKFRHAELPETPSWAPVQEGADFSSPTAERLDYIFVASRKKLRFVGERALYSQKVPSSPRVMREKKLDKVFVSDHLPIEQIYSLPSSENGK